MSTCNHVLPDAAHVASVLSGILMRKVTAQGCPPIRWPKTGAGAVAVYCTDEGRVAACCACDLPLAAQGGAALLLFPQPVAAESIRALKLEESLAENIREILNICAQLFNGVDRPHVALHAVYSDFRDLPPALANVISRSAPRLDVTVTIADYGSGRLSLFCN